MNKPIIKQAFLRFWKKKYSFLAGCLGLVLLLMLFFNLVLPSQSFAHMSLNYSEASLGLNPNQSRFNSSEILSEDVLSRAIESAGLTGAVTPSQLANCLSISPADESSDADNYINTTYQIVLTDRLHLSHFSSQALLSFVCLTYKDYFMEHYCENQGVFSSALPHYFETEPYLQLKSLSLRAGQLNRYLQVRVKESSSYTDQTSNVGFLELYKQIQNLITYDIPRVNAYILQSGLSVDKTSLLSMLQYKLQLANMNYNRQMAYYTADNSGISLYDKTMSAVVMIPTVDSSNAFYMSRTKTALDSLADEADASLKEAISYRDVISDTRNVIQQISAATSGSMSTVQTMMQSISTTLDALQGQLRSVDAAYINQKTQDYLAFRFSSPSFLARAGVNRLVAALVLYTLLFYALCLKQCIGCREEEKTNA